MALLKYCVVGDLEGVKQALNMGENVNSIDDYTILRMTPLMEAVRNGHKDLVRMLLDHPRLILLARDACGDTALHHSVRGGMEDITRMILERGGERRSNLVDRLVSAKNHDGKDPLHYAREYISGIVDEIREKEDKAMKEQKSERIKERKRKMKISKRRHEEMKQREEIWKIQDMVRKEKREREDKERKKGRENEVKEIRKRWDIEDRTGRTGVMGRKRKEVKVIKGAVPPINGSTLGVTCPACLESFTETMNNGGGMLSTVCGHVFCTLCLPKVIATKGNCPKCRKTLSKGDYHPIFLE